MIYAKMAFGNIRKNGKYYFPYMVAGIFTVAMYYIMCFIATNQGLEEMKGALFLRKSMELGSYIAAIFSFIFLIYANSFLMKRRKKEFGLYNILGLEKRHIGKIMFYENLCITVVDILVGIATGVVFSRLVLLLSGKVIKLEMKIGFSVSSAGIVRTVVLFFGLYFLILLGNLISIRRMNPIELLQSQSAGEREPKTKLLITIIGIATLGIGYGIALKVESSLEALTNFFMAVILVIVGTYCLFISGSIAILKLLRKNKKYYYKTNHFTAVSGMLYRMKKNAAGLASICILSTMVLVVISTTVSLYVGAIDAINYRYPNDFMLELEYDTNTMADRKEQNAAMYQEFQELLQKHVRKVVKIHDYENYSVFAEKVEEGYAFTQDYSTFSGNVNDLYVFDFYTKEDYERATEKSYSLKENEVLVYGDLFQKGDTIKLGNQEFVVADTLEKFSWEEDANGILTNITQMVVFDSSIIEKIYQDEAATIGAENANDIRYFVEADIDGTDEEKIAVYEDIEDTMDSGLYVECKQNEKELMYADYGSLFFLGIFLGSLFLMITVMIIYYKQITEGYEDRKRFEIMQNVGMSEKEVQTSIHSQILTVFMLPILVAACHVAGSFKMITKLLALFNLTNSHLFTICTISTILVFAVVYAAVYGITSRVYYKIVKGN